MMQSKCTFKRNGIQFTLELSKDGWSTVLTDDKGMQATISPGQGGFAVSVVEQGDKGEVRHHTSAESMQNAVSAAVHLIIKIREPKKTKEETRVEMTEYMENCDKQ